MFIKTSRFGSMEVEESRTITFPKGLLGFAQYKRFVLLEADKDECFWWLQSIESPGLAFVVTDPQMFVPAYRVPIREEHMESLDMTSLDDAQVFVIVNKHGSVLTGNFQGPLLVGVTSRTGEQLVLNEKRFNARTPLMQTAAHVTAA